MWKTLALTAAKLTLKLVAPKAGTVIDKIQRVAEVALPIVEQVAKCNANNNIKWIQAIDMTEQVIDRLSNNDGLTHDNVVESGVQLAYSLYKANAKEK